VADAGTYFAETENGLMVFEKLDEGERGFWRPRPATDEEIAEYEATKGES
jgi:hypothetical protein